MYEHKEGNLVACICEGNAEEEIIAILLANNLLKFKEHDLLDDKILSRSNRSAKTFQSRYLSQIFEPGQKIEVLRVIDSRNESFNISSEYKHQIEDDVTNCLTRPEIEMLIILKEGHYKKFNLSKHTKPSKYCSDVLGMGKYIKKKGFITNYFNNVDELVEVLEKYHRLRSTNNEHTIYSLLK